jgi:hypothetical protein
MGACRRLTLFKLKSDNLLPQSYANYPFFFQIFKKIIIFAIVEIFSWGLIDLSDSDLAKIDPIPPLFFIKINNPKHRKI